MAIALQFLRRTCLAILLGAAAWAPASSAQTARGEELAEGKYPYLSGFQTAARADDVAEGKYPYFSAFPEESPRVAGWAGLAAVMPDWKEKGKAAHYRFPLEKEGRKCDQFECHPGFQDAFVAQLLSVPEGSERQAAREPRRGLDRCNDCHTYGKIRLKAAACRLHFKQPERVQCTSCHIHGPRILIPVGNDKTVALRDGDPRAAWPVHRLTKDEKEIACDKACHIPDNPFAVTSICPDCHGEGRLEIASYTAPNVLVHATDKASMFPAVTDALFLILTYTVLGSLFAYIILEIYRSRKEGNP